MEVISQHWEVYGLFGLIEMGPPVVLAVLVSMSSLESRPDIEMVDHT